MTDLKKALDRLRTEVDSLRKTVHEYSIRLTLAQAWVELLNYGYDTLRAYNIDFKSLPEFQNTAILDEAMEMPMSQGQVKIIEHLGRLKSSIGAAIRRKQFRVH